MFIGLKNDTKSLVVPVHVVLVCHIYGRKVAKCDKSLHFLEYFFKTLCSTVSYLYVAKDSICYSVLPHVELDLWLNNKLVAFTLLTRPAFLPDPNDGSLYSLGGKNNEGLTVKGNAFCQSILIFRLWYDPPLSSLFGRKIVMLSHYEFAAVVVYTTWCYILLLILKTTRFIWGFLL